MELGLGAHRGNSLSQDHTQANKRILQNSRRIDTVSVWDHSVEHIFLWLDD